MLKQVQGDDLDCYKAPLFFHTKQVSVAADGCYINGAAALGCKAQ